MFENTHTYQLKEREEKSMLKIRPSYGEALAMLAKKNHFSDREDTLRLAQMIVDGSIAIEQIEPLAIQ